MEKQDRKGLLERLREGVVLGDGGMIFELEKRGYVKVGVWTPECTALHPDAGTCSWCIRHMQDLMSVSTLTHSAPVAPRLLSLRR